MSTGTVRVDPVRPPFPPELQAVFDKIMPPGVPPLTLFTTLARVPRTVARCCAGVRPTRSAKNATCTPHS